MIQHEELIEIMRSCFSDDRRRELFPSFVAERLPREVPENSVLEFTIQVFAQEIGRELYRIDMGRIEEAIPRNRRTFLKLLYRLTLLKTLPEKHPILIHLIEDAGKFMNSQLQVGELSELIEEIRQEREKEVGGSR